MTYTSVMPWSCITLPIASGVSSFCHEVNLVFFQHLVRDLLADVGLHLVVAVDHLDLEPRHLAPEVIEGELDRVPHVLADDALRARQRGDEADLHLLLRERRPGSEERGGETDCNGA